MCYSKADGGKRCFTHTTLESPKVLKERMKQAEKSGNRERYRKAKEDYCTTEEAIRRFEAKGDFKNAARFLRRHNLLVDQFNAKYGGNKKHLEDYETRMARLEAKAQAEREAEQRKSEVAEAKRAAAAAKKAEAAARKAEARKAASQKKPTTANASPWSRAGIHRETGTKFSPAGWSKDGINQITGTKWNQDGNDVYGYGQDGYHKVTGRNRAGWDREGYDEHLRDVKEFHKITGRNKQLPDRDGWGPEGWNLKGTIHRDTGTNLDPEGFDVNDYNPALGMFRKDWEALQAANLEPAHV